MVTRDSSNLETPDFGIKIDPRKSGASSAAGSYDEKFHEDAVVNRSLQGGCCFEDLPLSRTRSINLSDFDSSFSSHDNLF